MRKYEEDERTKMTGEVAGPVFDESAPGNMMNITFPFRQHLGKEKTTIALIMRMIMTANCRKQPSRTTYAQV